MGTGIRSAMNRWRKWIKGPWYDPWDDIQCPVCGKWGHEDVDDAHPGYADVHAARPHGYVDGNVARSDVATRLWP